MTGNFYLNSSNGSASGAFYSSNGRSGAGGSSYNACTMNIDASRSSSCYGLYQDSNNNRVIPDHIAVIVWKRTA